MYSPCLTFGHPAAPKRDTLLATCPVSGVHLSSLGHRIAPIAHLAARRFGLPAGLSRRQLCAPLSKRGAAHAGTHSVLQDEGSPTGRGDAKAEAPEVLIEKRHILAPDRELRVCNRLIRELDGYTTDTATRFRGPTADPFSSPRGDRSGPAGSR